MRLAHNDDDQIIAFTNDGLKLTLKEDMLVIETKKPTGGINRCNLDYQDAILMDRTLFKIHEPVYRELQRLRQICNTAEFASFGPFTVKMENVHVKPLNLNIKE